LFFPEKKWKVSLKKRFWGEKGETLRVEGEGGGEKARLPKSTLRVGALSAKKSRGIRKGGVILLKKATRKKERTGDKKKKSHSGVKKPKSKIPLIEEPIKGGGEFLKKKSILGIGGGGQSPTNGSPKELLGSKPGKNVPLIAQGGGLI